MRRDVPRRSGAKDALQRRAAATHRRARAAPRRSCAPYTRAPRSVTSHFARGRVRSLRATCCCKDASAFQSAYRPMRDATSARQCAQRCRLSVRVASFALHRPIAHAQPAGSATSGYASAIGLAIGEGDIRPAKGADHRPGDQHAPIIRLGRWTKRCTFGGQTARIRWREYRRRRCPR